MDGLLWVLPVVAYFYGAVPFGFLAAKWIRGVDIREQGSGNIGATNAARALGFRYFPVIFLLDFSKGFLPALAGVLLVENSAYSPPVIAVLAAIAAILGHVFPIYLRFKGGKAVAASTGAFAVLAPWCLLVAAGVWAVMFGIFRYVSLASISAAAALAVSVWVLPDDPLGAGVFLTVVATAGAAMVIALHHANIRRLLNGTEHKIGSGQSKDAGE